MKKSLIIAATVALAVIVLCAGLLLNQDANKVQPKAYVGVAYCGNTVEQGKLLIDKVRGYTNLFVLQSGLLERDFDSVNELGDYAVDSGMYFLPYFGVVVESSFSVWLQSAKERWGSHLLGVYYGDEPGGKMLDSTVVFRDAATGDEVWKTKYGDIVVTKQSGVVINYMFNGAIKLDEPPTAADNTDINSEETFYPNGTITVDRPAANGFSYQSYQELMAVKPFKDNDDAAHRFINRDKNNIDFLHNYTQVFTSDYGLHYFDYTTGYDVVLGQVGWNFSLNHQISLLRGAANQQSKDWGIFITWKYQHSPYLDNGTVILEQLTTAYQCGAKYFVLFDYYDKDSGTYGTMQQQHFDALQSFWREVLTNAKFSESMIKAEAAVVLPKNYGWGTRWNTDHIWGIFGADNKTEQIWQKLQQALQEKGLSVDIIFADTNSQFQSRYQYIYDCTNFG